MEFIGFFTFLVFLVLCLVVHSDGISQQEIVLLSQADFEFGTVLISQPGKYVLTEDIVFIPHNYTIPEDVRTLEEPELLLFPNASQRDPSTGKYSGRNFALGFFCAIMIDSDSVELDLAGFTIKQGNFHLLTQRFFAVIEVTNTPFPENEGPAEFSSASDFKTGTNVIIRNGIIGSSSHHGIHCNNCENLLLEDLIIEDFEVAGVSLNAAKAVNFTNVEVRNSTRDVLWSGRLSQAIFAMQAFTVHILPYVDLSGAEFDFIFEKRRKLRQEYLETLRHEQGGGLYDSPLFATVSDGLPDGSMVAGIILHPKVSTEDFLSKTPKEGEERTSDFFLHNVTVRNLAMRSTERTVLQKLPHLTTVSDMIGAVLDIDYIRDMSSPDFQCKLNPLADFQLGMSKLKNLLEDKFRQQEEEGTLSLEEEAVLKLLRRDAIDPLIIDWCEGRIKWSDILQNFNIENNHDFMFHLNKGVIGIKVDEAVRVSLSNVLVENLQNLGEESDRSYFFRNLPLANSNAESRDDRFDLNSIHFSKNEFTGLKVKGVSLAGSVEISGEVVVRDLYSTDKAFVTCVDLIDQNLDVNLKVSAPGLRDSPTLFGLLSNTAPIIPYVQRDEFVLPPTCNEEDEGSLKAENTLYFIVATSVLGISVVLLVIQVARKAKLRNVDVAVKEKKEEKVSDVEVKSQNVRESKVGASL